MEQERIGQVGDRPRRGQRVRRLERLGDRQLGMELHGPTVGPRMVPVNRVEDATSIPAADVSRSFLSGAAAAPAPDASPRDDACRSRPPSPTRLRIGVARTPGRSPPRPWRSPPWPPSPPRSRPCRPALRANPRASPREALRPRRRAGWRVRTRASGWQRAAPGGTSRPATAAGRRCGIRSPAPRTAPSGAASRSRVTRITRPAWRPRCAASSPPTASCLATRCSS